MRPGASVYGGVRTEAFFAENCGGRERNQRRPTLGAERARVAKVHGRPSFSSIDPVASKAQPQSLQQACPSAPHAEQNSVRARQNDELAFADAATTRDERRGALVRRSA